jgi:membrane-bound lytic murein transglycosylase D
VSSFKKKDNFPSSNQKESEYYVKKGDSLYTISKKYPGVTISDLKKWNNIKDDELKPGMKLKING